ncbi:uncharacterized protein EAF01_003172 [Botrytis porri]|uniref:uncharacterized protein n=1 Tax=Botrytis porri TaxID=87229 RepID=UPI001901C8F8|nr:uncharacterized protein EAF01_003172 [Botrytis porri]KAF7909454.1 hypothetical protein EAF01_003172 [Botrytis porri]
MAKKKNSSHQESLEDAATRLKKEKWARIHAEARQQIVERRILAAEEMAANTFSNISMFKKPTSSSKSQRTELHFLLSKAAATGLVDTFGLLPIEVKLHMFNE